MLSLYPNKKERKKEIAKLANQIFSPSLNLILLKSNNTAFSPLTQSVPLVATKEDSGTALPSDFFLEIRVLDTGRLIDLSSGGLDNYLLSLR